MNCLNRTAFCMLLVLSYPATLFSNDEILRDAKKATVRIQLENRLQPASGTVVERDGDTALIATCAHFIPEFHGRLIVDVAFFLGHGTEWRKGRVVSYNQHLDVGLVVVDHAPQTPVFPIANNDQDLVVGAEIVVAGCDFGLDPVVEEGAISALNRFAGRPNVEVTVKPEQGRSGGGLFTTNGYLIGVCNSYNPVEKEGVYASVNAIRQIRFGDDDSRSIPRKTAISLDQYRQAPALEGDQGAQIFCIITDAVNPQPRYYLITNPSAKVLEILSEQGQHVTP